MELFYLFQISTCIRRFGNAATIPSYKTLINVKKVHDVQGTNVSQYRK